jgi:alginate export protein
MDNGAQGTINRRVAMHIKKRVSGWLTLAVFATVGGLVASDPAFAKVDVDQLTIGGEARIRYEGRNNGALNSNLKANESAASHRVRVNVGYDLTPDVSFFAQIQDARNYGGEGNPGGSGIAAVSNNGIFGGTGLDLHQGYILVKNAGVPGLSVKIGRQEIMFGDHRLFGNFGWSQVGNSFDAVRLTHSTPIADVDLFWARIIDTEAAAAAAAGSGVFFPPAAGSPKGTTDQNVYGLYVTLKPIPNWTIEPYYFLLKDDRAPGTGTPAPTLRTPQAPSQTRSTVGGRINGKAGPLDATGELAWQFGSMSDNLAATSPTDNLHINAWAGAFKAGFTFDAVPMRPRVGIEFDYASGSNCTTTCGKNNTFDNLYPTNHFHYGYMDLMAWKNMVNYHLVFDVKPSPVSKLQVNFIIHRLANSKDNWYRAGQVTYGTSAATNQAASLGKELDIHYYRTIKEKFKFEIGVGHFWAGEWTAAGGNTIAGGDPNGSGQNWGYMMGSVLF